MNQPNPSNALVVSDHGLIIRELANGSLDGPGNPAKVSEFARLCKVKGCPVCGYYAFKHEKFDGKTIEALGKAMSSREAEDVNG